MSVADFNADAGIVAVQQSKAHKPRHVVLTDEGQRLFASLTAAAPAELGRHRRVRGHRREVDIVTQKESYHRDWRAQRREREGSRRPKAEFARIENARTELRRQIG
jgi:hypothetical protein